MFNFSKIKEYLKKYRMLKQLYYKMRKLTFITVYKISPALHSNLLFRIELKKKLDLKNPKSFNEKLMWLKLYFNHKLTAQCADKIEMRSYVEQYGYSNVLNEIYYIYNNTDEIDFSLLPDKFVLKCNHGCGFNIICTDKDKIDVENIKKKLNSWLKVRYDFFAGELQYKKMRPRIICEKYIQPKHGTLPNDYKVYCFNGKPLFILVCADRESQLKLCLYNTNWHKLNLLKSDFDTTEECLKPASLNEMLHISQKLSIPFPFVRVDFYDVDGSPVLSEMTFTPAACMAKYYTDEGDLYLGSLLKLPDGLY
jgi:hypothetical protein